MFRSALSRRTALALAAIMVSLSLLQAMAPALSSALARPARLDGPVRQLLLSLCVTSGSSRLLKLLEGDGPGRLAPPSSLPGEPMRLSHDGHCALCGTDPDLPALAGPLGGAHPARLEPVRWRSSYALRGPFRQGMGQVRARAPPVA